MPDCKARKTLLLVEDDSQIRLLLTMILDHIGYQVRVAEDGFAALRSMREGLPETIISDLYMPGMSGFELLSVVRRRFPFIRVIAMSASFSGHEVPEGVAADGFYQKGNDLEELLSMLAVIPNGENLCRTPQTAASTPMWIAENGHPPGSACITVTCPECLRTFPQVVGDSRSPIHETGCIYCSTPVQYAIVRPAESMRFAPLLTM
jgi:CheY-like chemotaxis protein